MKRFISGLFLLVMLAFAGNVAFAQGNGIAEARVAADKSSGETRVRMPFTEGETFTYEGKLKRVLLTIPVGEMTFTVGRQLGSSAFTVNAEAVSKGTLLKILRFSFLQRFDSTIDAADLRTLRTVKHDVQKDRIRDSEANFDYAESKVTFVETDPNNPARPPRMIASELEGNTNDIITALYSLRLQPLAVGKTFEISVSDSGLVYRIPVKVTGRERERTALGRVWCYRLEAEVFGPGRLIEQEGSMTVWITEDARRIPVRGLVDSSIGKLDIRLKSAKNIGPLPPRS